MTPMALFDSGAPRDAYFPFIMATFYLARFLTALFPKRFIQTEANLSNNANLLDVVELKHVNIPQRCAN